MCQSSLHNVSCIVQQVLVDPDYYGSLSLSKLFVLVVECGPPAFSSTNPDDPDGPPICADWEVGPFGRVIMTDICFIIIYDHCYVSLTYVHTYVHQ